MANAVELRVSKIANYFSDNPEVFSEIMERFDDWCGYLNDDRRQSMDFIDELFWDEKPSKLVNIFYYGYDEGVVDSIFNPNRDYFYFDGVGRIVSTDSIDYSDYLCSDTILKIAENWGDIDLYGIDIESEITVLFDELYDLLA